MRDLAIGVVAGTAAGAALSSVLARLIGNVAAVDVLTTGASIPADPRCRHRRRIPAGVARPARASR